MEKYEYQQVERLLNSPGLADDVRRISERILPAFEPDFQRMMRRPGVTLEEVARVFLDEAARWKVHLRAFYGYGLIHRIFTILHDHDLKGEHAPVILSAILFGDEGLKFVDAGAYQWKNLVRRMKAALNARRDVDGLRRKVESGEMDIEQANKRYIEIMVDRDTRLGYEFDGQFTRKLLLELESTINDPWFRERIQELRRLTGLRPGMGLKGAKTSKEAEALVEEIRTRLHWTVAEQWPLHFCLWDFEREGLLSFEDMVMAGLLLRWPWMARERGRFVIGVSVPDVALLRSQFLADILREMRETMPIRKSVAGRPRKYTDEFYLDILQQYESRDLKDPRSPGRVMNFAKKYKVGRSTVYGWIRRARRVRDSKES